MSLLTKGFVLKKYGNSWGLGPISNPWITIGPDWPLVICVSTTILVVEAAFCFFMAGEVGEYVRAAGYFIINFTAFSFFYTVLRNPGMVLRDEGEDGRRCKDCDLYVEEGTQHCHDCGVCIQQMDHHCIFMGKCVGRNNLWSFYAFLVSVGLTFMYSAIWGISMAHSAKLRRSNT